jgi:hypothetical protein
LEKATVRVTDVYKKVRNKTLTCSDVAGILASQKTGDGTSHAHMHMTDGFRSDPYKIIENHTFGLDAENRGAKKRDWGLEDAHLFPSGQSKLPQYDPGNKAAMRKGTVYMDPSRQAPDNSYNVRTNLPEVLGVPAVFRTDTAYYVMRLPAGGKGAPIKIEIGNPAEAARPVGDTNLYVMDGLARKVIEVNRQVVVTAAVPRIPETSAHTMFEDSESMVMHLTGALKSDAGAEVLKTLTLRGAGDKRTVGVFSKTAVRAVNAKFGQVAATKGQPAPANRMMNRVADSAPDRSPTGSFTVTRSAFDHVVLVLAAAEDWELVVVTGFPSGATTGASIGCATTDQQDVVEHTFGSHTIVPVTAPLPGLDW